MTTLSVYAQVLEESDERAAAVIGESLLGADRAAANRIE
jgi:hypothetical protein